jgi:hypothetical protein
MGFHFDSEQLTVGTMLRDRASRKTKPGTKGQLFYVFAGIPASGLAWHNPVRAEVLRARKLPDLNQREQPGEVESEAVATPIIKGTLVIESEETR